MIVFSTASASSSYGKKTVARSKDAGKKGGADGQLLESLLDEGDAAERGLRGAEGDEEDVKSAEAMRRIAEQQQEEEGPESPPPSSNSSDRDWPAPSGVHAGETKRCCAVCLEDYEDGEKLRVLPCQHRFHTACIDQWFGARKVCPVCRYPASNPPLVQVNAADGSEVATAPGVRGAAATTAAAVAAAGAAASAFLGRAVFGLGAVGSRLRQSLNLLTLSRAQQHQQPQNLPGGASNGQAGAGLLGEDGEYLGDIGSVIALSRAARRARRRERAATALAVAAVSAAAEEDDRREEEGGQTGDLEAGRGGGGGGATQSSPLAAPQQSPSSSGPLEIPHGANVQGGFRRDNDQTETPETPLPPTPPNLGELSRRGV